VSFPKDALEAGRLHDIQIAAITGHSLRAVRAILDAITATETRRLLRTSSASSKHGRNSQLLQASPMGELESLGKTKWWAGEYACRFGSSLPSCALQ